MVLDCAFAKSKSAQSISDGPGLQTGALLGRDYAGVGKGTHPMKLTKYRLTFQCQCLHFYVSDQYGTEAFLHVVWR
jgi:hypothetical protein